MPCCESTFLQKKEYVTINDTKAIAETYFSRDHPQQDKELVKNIYDMDVKSLWGFNYGLIRSAAHWFAQDIFSIE